ncbi:glycosyltransferase family 4 protein [Thermoanaerobacterium thermosaccharolyticum]|uniref:glycosyltransferase family 4 protein n=1 Tax=Thermoanaerobacterium thermosaccharolyticum TaxID=1517 RepID=UPI003DA8A7B2
MKVLLLTQNWPNPPISGEAAITYNLIKELGNKHDIYLITIDSSKSNNYKEMTELKYKEIIKVEMKKNIFGYIISLVLPYPYGIYTKYKKSAGEKIKESIYKINPDIIVVGSLGLAIYYKYFPEKKPKQLIAADSLPMVMDRLAKDTNNIFKKVHYLSHKIKATNYERDIYPKFDSVVYVSEIDANEAKKSSKDIKIDVISNGVDIEKFKSRNNKKILHSICFTGNLGYIPNEKAAYRLCTEIFPLVKKEISDAKVYIIGVNPSDRLKKLNNDSDIFITGYVNDIVDYLDRMEVFCSFLEAGGGIKNKILEAMSVGLPVVGTRYCFEGIEGNNGKHYIIVDDISSAASNIVKLIREEKIKNYLSFNARNLIEKKYSWKFRAEQYNNIWEYLRWMK